MLVREVMTTPVVTLPPATSIRQAVRLLYEQNITAAPLADDDGRLAGIVREMIATGLKGVPVLRGDTLVGIVSRRDLMGVLAHSDAPIRDDVLARTIPGVSRVDVVDTTD
jgi:CBS domain-containing protein